MLAAIARQLQGVPPLAFRVARYVRRPVLRPSFRRNFAQDIGVVNLVVGQILPRETIEMLNMVAFEPGDPSARALRSYIQAIVIEMASDGDWLPLYEQAFEFLGRTDRSILVRAVLEMQGREVAML